MNELELSDEKQKEYETEAAARWGHTDAWKESKRRTAGYSKADWDEIKREAGDIFQRLAAELDKGTPATSAIAMDLAEAHRQHITRRFYDCPRGLHAAIGQGYVDDTRFTVNIDAIRPGLSAYARDAFAANAAQTPKG